MVNEKNNKFSFETSAEDVAEAFSREIQGKNVLITGTSLNGIGYETVKAIAKYAKLVVMTGHNAERLQLAEQALKKDNPRANLRRLIVDLSSMASVRKAAVEVLAYPEPLHVLIHNAAAHFGPQIALSADGLDSQFATDHVGPFLLTKLLLPKLYAALDSSWKPRVIFVSSLAHSWAESIDYDHLLKPKTGKYEAFNVYCQAKTANVIMGIELSRRSKGQILGYSVHPGAIFTNVHSNPDVIPMLQAFGNLTEDGKPNTENFQWKTLGQGAATTVAAAFDPSLIETPGAYLDDSTVANASISAHAAGPLWSLTEQIVGEKFEF
ncbi:Short-chain dehydrogenase/reductase family protein [Mycena indigotica]|uniref:Short-chain dehydrogenase/reductase family protein n=1 Tax=Mycena indigotica TaxID=2126181 RepID=A0A8H6SIJ6_9AGAR|nr:Short-chain dehydrogenase/reductase family protein [Mycena indigotica]KAF7299497.1 Short-chain dehydrogenase/reductase family protein [Mycena indigotica]